MSESDLHAQTNAAAVYEDLFVPALFRDWAPRTVKAAHVRRGQRVLDVACGTGVVARTAAAQVGAEGSVIGVDPNPGMLAVAAQLAPGIQWRQGTAESLPIDHASIDAVVSQFGWMFFADRRAALQEMLRVLVKGGRFAVTVWDALEEIPAYAALVALLQRAAGDRAADALRPPFALGDRGALAALFEDSGVDSLAVTTESATGRFPNIRTMVEADLRGWLPVVGVVLPETQIAHILAESESVLRPYVTAEGSVSFAVSAHIVSGMKRR